MAQAVNGQMMNEFIHHLYKNNPTDAENEVLEKIAEKGKELLGDLNATNKDVCEIIDDIDNLYEEMIKWQEDVTDAEGNVNKSQKSLSELYAELDPLTRKEANGTLTEEEKVKLKGLREQVAIAESKFSNGQGTLNSLSNDSIADIISNNFAILDSLTADMEGYAEAGEVIKSQVPKWSTRTFMESGAFGVALIAMPWSKGKEGDDAINNYLDKLDYTSVDSDAETYYDEIDNEYIAEYDVLNSALNGSFGRVSEKANVHAKVHSYGQTITTAAHEIEKKPDAVKAKRVVD